jgi:nitroreductase
MRRPLSGQEENRVLHELISRRWSPRAFEDRPVEPEKLAVMFEAARWAASSFNEQPWRFVWAARHEHDLFARLFDCLAEKNQLWAEKAPVLFLTVAARKFSHNGKPNRHNWHDVGLAMGNLSLQAASMGLMIHQMAGFNPDKARENIKIPVEFEPVAMVAAGYPGDPDSLPAQFRPSETAERTRKPLTELVFHGEWDERSGLA